MSRARCEAYFLGSGVPSGAASVVVNRTSNTTTMWAVGILISAATDTEVYLPGIVLTQNNAAPAEQSVNDGSPGTNSMRFAGVYYGGATPAPAGTSSTQLVSGGVSSGPGDATAYGWNVVRETTAGQGARNVGCVNATSDDNASVHLAVREQVTPAPATLAVTTTQPAAAVTEYAPALELSGFTITGPGSSDTIEWVQVAVAQFQSSALMGAPRLELWDGTSAQIGADAFGTQTTSSAQRGHVHYRRGDVLPARRAAGPDLRELRHRPGRSHPVGRFGVGLTVSYSPSSATNATVTMGSALAATVTIPAPVVRQDRHRNSGSPGRHHGDPRPRRPPGPRRSPRPPWPSPRPHPPRSVRQDRTAAPATAAFSTGQPLVTVTTTGNATAAPATLAAATAQPAAAVSTTAGATATPAVLAVTAAQGTVTVTAVSNATVTPATLAVTAAQPAVTVTTAAGATATPATLAVTAGQPPVTVLAYPETSPALELSGFGAFSAIGASDTIEWVQVAMTEHQSDSSTPACTFELWDYSGTPAQIGTTQTGTASTSTGNVSAATFTGVTYGMLATLRVRVYGHSGTAAPGATQSVDGASLTVSYSPSDAGGATAAPAVKAVTTAFPAVTVTVPARPAVLAVATAQPAPSVTTSGNATVTPAVLAVATSVPFSAAGSSVSITLIADDAITAPAAFPAVTVTTAAGATAAPAALAVTTAQPGVTVTAGTGTAAAPATLAVASSIPAPVVRQDQNAAPAVKAATTTIPAPAVTAGGSATAAPATLAVTTSAPAPVVRQDQAVTVTALAAATTQPVPAVTATSNAAAAPATLTVTTARPAPTVTTSTSATATPATLTATAAFPQSAASAGGSATAAPAAVVIAAAISVPQVRQDRTLIPAAVAVTVTVPAAGAAGGASPAPATLTILAAFPARTVSTGMTAAPSVVAVTVDIPQSTRPPTFGTARQAILALAAARDASGQQDAPHAQGGQWP